MGNELDMRRYDMGHWSFDGDFDWMPQAWMVEDAERDAERNCETKVMSGRRFTAMDADDRRWYLADEDHEAWITENEDFTAAVVHCDGAWRCEVTWGEEYVNGGAREFATPEEAAEAVLAAYAGVLTGTVNPSDWC